MPFRIAYYQDYYEAVLADRNDKNSDGGVSILSALLTGISCCKKRQAALPHLRQQAFHLAIASSHWRWYSSADAQWPERRSCSASQARWSARFSLARTYPASSTGSRRAASS